MGDENPIRTLGDYSKPSHEGYRNTIELPVGNNVVPLRSDTLLGSILSQDESSINRPMAISLPQDVPSTSNSRLIELKNQVQRLMEAYLAPEQLVQVNKISSSCEICSGPHDTQYYMENPEQAFVKYASSRNDEVGGKQFTTNLGPRNLDEATNDWKDKPNFNWSRAQTFTSPQTGLLSTYTSSYQTRLEKSLIRFDISSRERHI
ncbi:hypothetical protein Tco_0299733 [Tanacetum coccineum]